MSHNSVDIGAGVEQQLAQSKVVDEGSDVQAVAAVTVTQLHDLESVTET